LLFCNSIFFAQSDKIKDSLMALINTCKVDTQKVIHYNALVSHFQSTDPTQVEEYGKKNLEFAKKIGYTRGEAMAAQSLGEFYNAKGAYGFALENFLVSSKIYEKLKDYKKASIVSNSIGNTYLGLKDNDKALEFYKLAFSLGEQGNSKLAKAYASAGISSVYSNQGKYGEAIDELRFSKMVFENANKDLQAAFIYSNMAELFNSMGNLDSATYYAKRALPIMEKYNSRYGKSLTYQILGNIDFSRDKLNSALNYYFMTLQIAEEDKAIDNQKEVCLQIFKLFEKKGNAEQALAYYKKFISLKDSIYNSDSRGKLFELQTKYDSETKEKENRLLQQDKMIAKKSLQTQRILFYFIAGILILVFVFSYISFKNLKKQKKMNIILQQQKELVEQSRKEILDSIMYAKRIQTTILAHKEFIDDHISKNFIFFKPKDIVSGDFYWATKRNNLFYLAVCDSTGHGVPGAFMSLLSISFLNEAIGEKNITKPNEVFNYVRQKLIENISKEGQKDGFDGVLLCMNQDTKEITYAAANNRPVVVSAENKLMELASDRMPVGYGERKEDFSLHSIQLQKNDTLYLFTDGYADQFGGPKGKKLMYKKLHEFLINIADQPFETQTDALNTNFDSWKGNLEQVDDVCVIGLRVA
jgi:serine phosphatase RsbU (regulator of sigma subunit)